MTPASATNTMKQVLMQIDANVAALWVMTFGNHVVLAESWAMNDHESIQIWLRMVVAIGVIFGAILDCPYWGHLVVV